MTLPSSPANDPFGPFRLRDYNLLVATVFFTNLAHQAQSVAIGWDLYERTGSALALGWVGLFHFLPVILLFLPAGQLADQFDRRAVVVLSLVAWCASNVVLLLAPASDAGVPWIYFAAVAIGVAMVVNRPARDALMAQVLPPEMLGKATAWNSSLFQVASIVGPAFAGWMISTSASANTVYGCNIALTVIACVLTLVMARRSFERAQRPRTWRELFAGLEHVVRTKEILAVITLDLFAVLFGGAAALLPVYAKDILHVGATGLGWLSAAPAVGALVTSTALGVRWPFRRTGVVFAWSVAAYGAATVVFGLSPTFWLSFLALVATGALDSVSVVIRNTVVLLYTPDGLRGRVSAVNRVFVSSSNEIGAFRSGVMAAGFGPVATVVAGGAVTVAFVAAGIRYFPSLLKLGTLAR